MFFGLLWGWLCAHLLHKRLGEVLLSDLWAPLSRYGSWAHDVQPECVTGRTTCNLGSPSPKRSAVQVRFFAQELHYVERSPLLEEYSCKYQNGNQCYTSLLEANSPAQDFVTTFKGIVSNLFSFTGIVRISFLVKRQDELHAGLT